VTLFQLKLANLGFELSEEANIGLFARLDGCEIRYDEFKEVAEFLQHFNAVNTLSENSSKSIDESIKLRLDKMSAFNKLWLKLP